MKLSAASVALIAVFAAVQALLAVLPFTLTLGVSGQITLGIIGGSLIGILLGPAIGGLAVLIGSIVGVFLNPAGALFGIFTVLPSSTGAFAAGCVKTRRAYAAGAVMLAALLVFYANPVGREAYIYTWLHIVAAIVAFSPLAHVAGSTFKSPDLPRSVFGIIVGAFIGVLTDHIVGSAVAIWYFSIPATMWHGAMPIYPIERTVAMILVVAIATPTYYSLRKAGLIDAQK